MQYAYLFEARGIQRFLFASGKLRDMLGGSELLDYLCADGGLLDQTLRALNLNPAQPRRAGAALYLVFNREAEAQRFRAAWRLACAQWLPGVEQIDALAEGVSARDAIKQGLTLLREARNQLAADLPRPGPMVERSPRTGLAAIARTKGESLDAATYQQRHFERPANSQTLAKRFLDEEGYLWPVNFEENSRPEQRFPLGDRSLVGLLHADGNGLGELLRVLNDACKNADDATYIKLYRCFSDGLTEATQKAAQDAARAILLPNACENVLPARPLVLGGDDLTILLRADLALPYARVFLTAFEEHSKKSLQALFHAFKDAGLGEQATLLPTHLTACAGICFMKCSQPFKTGHDLAEGLCKRAKKESRLARKNSSAPMPATLAFHKVQEALLEDAETQFTQNHCFEIEGRHWSLALPAYALERGNGIPALDDLVALLGVFGKNRLNDRPLRELATLWPKKPAAVSQAYTRWRTLAKENQPNALKAFDAALEALLLSVPDTDWPCSNHENAKHSPLSDVLSLLTLIQENPEKEMPLWENTPSAV